MVRRPLLTDGERRLLFGVPHEPDAQGLRMKDAGEDLLHVPVIPCGH